MIALKPTSSSDILSLLSPSGGEQVTTPKDGNFLSLFNNLLNQSQEGKPEDQELPDSLSEGAMHFLHEPPQSESKNHLGNSVASNNQSDKCHNGDSQSVLEVDEDGSVIRDAHNAKGDVGTVGAKHNGAETDNAFSYQGGSDNDKGRASSGDTKESDQKVLEPKAGDHKQTVVIETTTPTGKIVVEQSVTANKFVTTDLKSMTETIRAEISNFQASDLNSGSITIKIKPTNLGEIVIIMEKETIPAGSKVFDKTTGAPIDIRLVASNPEVRNYLNLIKREVGVSANVRSINITNQVAPVKSSEKSSFDLREKGFIDQILDN